MNIPCPNCGARPIEEFHFGGEIPAVPASRLDPDAADLDRAWMITNAEGPATERWFHEYGCCRWLTLVRDTRTNEIL